MGTAGCAADDDAAPADANDGTEATNARSDATFDVAYATCITDSTTAAILRTDLLRGRGGFHSK